jgi:fatty acid desaturase
MTFEQPASLNRFVAEPIPLTWASRWKFIRIFLPLLIFFSIVMLERLAFEMWKLDKFQLALLWLALMPSGFLLIVFFILGEIRMRSSHKSDHAQPVHHHESDL